MQIAEVKFTVWDKAYWFDPAGLSLNLSDKVIVSTELGTEIGDVVGLSEINIEKFADKEIKKIIRKATPIDLEKKAKKEAQKDEYLRVARETVRQHKLEMKIADAHFSFDSGRVTFVFIADGRIDFRNLVKDLTHRFQKSIRFHQIGVRDEAQYFGDFGPCGQKLCCQQFLNKLGQVSGDFVETQQIAHRGSDRLSGMCGRLKCCLKFEQNLYEDLAKNLPSVGTRVRTDHGRGQIISHNILKRSVNVKLDGKDKDIVEVAIKKDLS